MSSLCKDLRIQNQTGQPLSTLNCKMQASFNSQSRPIWQVLITWCFETPVFEINGFRAANPVCTEKQPIPASTAHKERRAFQTYRWCPSCRATCLSNVFNVCTSERQRVSGSDRTEWSPKNSHLPSSMKTKRSTSGAIDGSFWRQNVEASRKTKQTWLSKLLKSNLRSKAVKSRQKPSKAVKSHQKPSMWFPAKWDAPKLSASNNHSQVLSEWRKPWRLKIPTCRQLHTMALKPSHQTASPQLSASVVSCLRCLAVSQWQNDLSSSQRWLCHAKQSTTGTWASNLSS